MTEGEATFERFRATLRADEDLASLVPFVDMYLVSFKDRDQAAVLFDRLAQSWVNARGLRIEAVR